MDESEIVVPDLSQLSPEEWEQVVVQMWRDIYGPRKTDSTD